MFRLMLILAVAANLLLCPLRCVTGCSAVDAGIVQPDSGCSCCHPVQIPTSEDENRPGEYPNDDCSCPNCICEGATLGSVAPLWRLNLAATCVLTGLTSERLSVGSTQVKRRENEGWLTELNASARRAALQRWLI